MDQDVNTGAPSEAPASEGVNTQEQDGVTTEERTPIPAPQAGDKTEPNLLLKSLQEERVKVRLLEEELQALKQSSVSSEPEDEEVFSDEGRALKTKISALEGEIAGIKSATTKAELQGTHPVLKEVWSDFEEFRKDPENKGMNMRTAAKAFMAEKGLLEGSPRKGLEKPTGGTHASLNSGMSADDIKNLRETNYRKYTDMLKKGQIKISE